MNAPHNNKASNADVGTGRNRHSPPRHLSVAENYFDAESADDPVVPLKLSSNVRERLNLDEPPIKPLPDNAHLAQVVSKEDGAATIRDQAQRSITHEPIRSTKCRTASGIRERIEKRNNELENEKVYATAKLAQHDEIDTIEQPRKDSDGKNVKLNINQLVGLWIDRLAVVLMLGLEAIVATTQVLNSYLPAGDHWLTAIAIGIPPVLGFFYAMRARPLDLKHNELPTFNETLTRRGVQLSVFVIVLFAFLLGESSGTTSMFSGEGHGPSSWKQGLFTCSLMLLLAINAKNTFRLIRETQAKLIEFVPVKNLHYKYWSERVANLSQTQDANADIANEMLVIQERIEHEAELNAQHEEGVFHQHVANVKGARAAGASQAAQQISQLFSRN